MNSFLPRILHPSSATYILSPTSQGIPIGAFIVSHHRGNSCIADDSLRAWCTRSIQEAASTAHTPRLHQDLHPFSHPISFHRGQLCLLADPGRSISDPPATAYPSPPLSIRLSCRVLFCHPAKSVRPPTRTPITRFQLLPTPSASLHTCSRSYAIVRLTSQVHLTARPSSPPMHAWLPARAGVASQLSYSVDSTLFLEPSSPST